VIEFKNLMKIDNERNQEIVSKAIYTKQEDPNIEIELHDNPNDCNKVSSASPA
jgi:hypothetical protein